MTSSANAQGLLMGSSAEDQVREFDKIFMSYQPPASTEIVEQPKARGLRFRYECEGRNAGSIPGENSTQENRTYPKIRINNSDGCDAIVVVSCVSKDGPRYRPHPHSLVGKDCKSGVCTVKLKKVSHAAFPNLGVQCAKKREVGNALKEREKLRVDPYQTGFGFDPTSVDLSVVRLCFQVFLPDQEGKFTRIVPPVVSQCIYDKKTVSDLVICRISRHAGSVRGGEDVFLLCDKVNREDIEVRFYEETEDGVMWEARGDFGQQDVHRQFAIVFRTPPYRDLTITEPKTVFLQLRRPSDDVRSETRSFTYAPIDPDPYGLVQRKKKRLDLPEYMSGQGEDMQARAADSPGKAALKDHLMKERVIAKPRTRRSQPNTTVVKEENPPELAPCAIATQQQPIEMPKMAHIGQDGNTFTDMDHQGMMMGDVMQNPQMMAQGWGQPGMQQYVQDMDMPNNPGNPGNNAAEGGDNNVHTLLSSLANGGNNSIQLDSGSLLQFLQDDPENPGGGLIQYLQSTDPDMQS